MVVQTKGGLPILYPDSDDQDEVIHTHKRTKKGNFLKDDVPNKSVPTKKDPDSNGEDGEDESMVRFRYDLIWLGCWLWPLV